MNAAIYLFGDLGDGYTQYPYDYASNIFKKFYKNAQAETQIIVHRDNALMYYAYIRKLEAGNYFGICFVFNGVVFRNIYNLFFEFENVFAFFESEGHLIGFNEHGKVVPIIRQLDKEPPDKINKVVGILRGVFSSMESELENLPPVDYSISKNIVEYFLFGDDIQKITASSVKSGYTYVCKSENYNTLQINSFQVVLEKVNKEKELLKKKVLRQKSQMSIVLVLLVIVFLFGGGLLTYHQKLNRAETNLQDSQQEFYLSKQVVAKQRDTILNLEKRIVGLQSNLENLQYEKQKMDSVYSDLKYFMPIVIYGVEMGSVNSSGEVEIDYGKMLYADKTNYLQPRITYRGIENGKTIFLYFKLYSESGGLLSSTTSALDFTRLEIEEGENTAVMEKLRGYNWANRRRGEYRLEIWYRDVCLKSKTFTIY